jgi:hypothetical protein
MLHGFGGSKLGFEAKPLGGTSSDPLYDNLAYAKRGYAVVTPSARGFAGSCGPSVQAATPGCERGWLHTADQRYEIRDAQTLLGMLVDQGVADPKRLGSTGISYGGGTSMQLAYLRDRIRLVDGKLAPWRTPKGTRLALAGAWARWPWSDLGLALVRNGRLRQNAVGPPTLSSNPVGTPITSLINGLYFIRGFTPPRGADPTADLEKWKEVFDEPSAFTNPDSKTILRELTKYHSAAGLFGESPKPAPLLLQSGWTDDLFPPIQSVNAYNDILRKSSTGAVALQLGDLGHPRATNKANTVRFFDEQGAAFLDASLRGKGSAPKPGSVVAFTQTCPKTAPARGPYTAPNLSALADGATGFGSDEGLTITSAGNPSVSSVFDPIALAASASGDCTSIPAVNAPGSAVISTKVTRGFTLLGMPTLTLGVSTTSSAAQIDANLWDVSPAGRQTLVTRGTYRLAKGSRNITFDLDGNGWRFDRGHTLKVELLGRDAPRLLAPPSSFKVALSFFAINLPTRGKGGSLQ